ncbi:hypothetical protein [Streptomyces triticirhizae]|uniref:hypothetical protein n=1 Tax=Streptomyces triticirhizae TaxID=2483353 RepID=UPI001F475F50|nr:hypothetical protein [Streptomyces triticirhizae]
MDDCVGPAYDSVRRAVSSVLARESDGAETVYALAAAESEAWLLLFPDAFPLHRPSWRIPRQLQGKDTGRRKNPKEELGSVLANPSFRESDGPEILARGLANGLLDKPNGSNRSYSEFVGDLTRWRVPS